MAAVHVTDAEGPAEAAPSAPSTGNRVRSISEGSAASEGSDAALGGLGAATKDGDSKERRPSKRRSSMMAMLGGHSIKGASSSVVKRPSTKKSTAGQIKTPTQLIAEQREKRMANAKTSSGKRGPKSRRHSLGSTTTMTPLPMRKGDVPSVGHGAGTGGAAAGDRYRVANSVFASGGLTNGLALPGAAAADRQRRNSSASVASIGSRGSAAGRAAGQRSNSLAGGSFKGAGSMYASGAFGSGSFAMNMGAGPGTRRVDRPDGSGSNTPIHVPVVDNIIVDISDWELFRRYGLFNPQSSFRISWDLTTVLLLFYILMTVPYRVAFEGIPTDFELFIEWIVDIFFITDLIVNFRTGYIDNVRGEVVMHPRRIAVNYLRTWFVIDFLSSIPVDRFLPEASATSYGAADDSSFDGQNLKVLKAGKAVKAFKLLRLAKLLRFLKLSTIMERVEETFSINRVGLKIFKLVSGTLILCHFNACIWYLLASFSEERDTWLTRMDLQNDKEGSKYLISFYYIVSTVMTVGYGDVTPTTDGEQLFTVYIMIVGAGFFGFILANMANLVSKLDAHAQRYHDKMDAMRSYMKNRNLPKELQQRIQRYYKHYLDQKTAFDERELLGELSTFLRQEVALCIINETIYSIPFFRERDPHFLAQLLTVLNPLTCGEGDFVIQKGEEGREMYIVISGLMEVLGKNGEIVCQLEAGGYFGEATALGISSKHFVSVRAITYCEMYSLSRRDLTAAFQEDKEILREMKTIATQELATVRWFMADDTAQRRRTGSNRNGSPTHRKSLLRGEVITRQTLHRWCSQLISNLTFLNAQLDGSSAEKTSVEDLVDNWRNTDFNLAFDDTDDEAAKTLKQKLKQRQSSTEALSMLECRAYVAELQKQLTAFEDSMGSLVSESILVSTGAGMELVQDL